MHLLASFTTMHNFSFCTFGLMALLFAAHCFAESRDPDTFSCNPLLGMTLKRPSCEAALSNLPRGNLPSIFTTRQGAPTNNWIHVPKRYYDSDHNPECSISVDLDGHSQHNVFVLIPWDKVRAMASDVISSCIDGLSWGGWETYGLNASFEALMPPSPYDSHTPAIPAVIHNPDGSEASTIAIPEGYGQRPGFSKSNSSVPIFTFMVAENTISPVNDCYVMVQTIALSYPNYS